MTPEKKKCFYIQPDQVPHPENGFQVSLIVEGDAGHRPLGDYMGTTYLEAQATCVIVNLNTFQVSERDAHDILLSTLGSDEQDIDDEL